jgi:aldehyde dehydrogenase (NAD+)
MTEVASSPSRVTLSSHIDRLLERQRLRAPLVGRSSAAERRRKIRALHDALFARRDEIRQAMWLDFRKPATEVDLSEIWVSASEARHAARNVANWMRPKRVATPLALFGARSEIRYEARGVVLIISPWNFPFTLTFQPLISAIAAGNCAIVKPSELTPHSSACIARILGDLFEEDEVAVVEGGVETSTELLRRRFDHIFFTGSPRVGRVVMKAAAEHLTSVTLELGGKSPVIVDATTDLADAARKIVFGKMLNGGQTCIAPDYILVERTVREEFVRHYSEQSGKLYGSPEALSGSSGYARLVNDKSFERLQRLVADAGGQGASIAGGDNLASERFIAPTLITEPPVEAAVMKEEIFGPLLPILAFDDLSEAISRINEGEKPLVIYVFSRDDAAVERVLSETSSGGVVANDTLANFYHVGLPFGGVGESGIGKSHGRFGFEAFSNAKSVVKQNRLFSVGQLLYPPYGRFKKWVVDFTMRWM